MSSKDVLHATPVALNKEALTARRRVEVLGKRQPGKGSCFEER